MRAINLIVGCTNRKRYPTAPGLAVREFAALDLDSRMLTWRERLKTAPAERYPADSLYMGDHWAVARSIASQVAGSGLDVRLWVCSAGYGLIYPDTLLKPYQATFSPGSEDYVAAGTKDRAIGIRQWWQGVCQVRLGKRVPRTLAQLSEIHPRTPMLVALSLDYLNAVSDDLKQVLQRPFFQEYLSIVSCGTAPERSEWAENLLPCDGLVAGTLGGSLTSLNVRVARHLLQALDGVSPSLEQMIRLARAIPRNEAPPRASRRPRTDTQVLSFITRALRRNPAASHSKLLRAYRDSGRACEQQRFAKLYRTVCGKAGQ